MAEMKSTGEGVILSVYVQPRASANKIAGIHENALKIRLTAPPVNNAANRMCIKFLSEKLKIPASSMNIISGHGSRKKQIFIRCPDADTPPRFSQKITRQVTSLAQGK